MKNIILEGPDNAGKSTLAELLSKTLRIPIRHSGGPSKYEGEVNERAGHFNSDKTHYIYDRHPCVSQNIYVAALGNGGEIVRDEHLDKFYSLKPFIIYCRSKGNLEGHQQSEHSSMEYFNQVEKNYQRLCAEYDKWAFLRAQYIYRIGDDTQVLAHALMGVTA